MYQIDVKKQVDHVFSIANSLRGTYQADKYKDVIIPMTIIRRLECALEETKDAVCIAYEQDNSTPDAILKQVSRYPFYNTSRYTLEKLLAEPAQLHRNLKTYLEAFSPNIRMILDKEEGLDFFSQIDKMHKGSRLTGVVRKFAELDLAPERINNVAMGYMFEEIIRRFSENVEAGDHYTPREVVRLLVRLGLAEGSE
ncbi:type I restriction-modification system subunit M N-terminal domain-containing protein [Varibaculum cambriense]|nr:type I restriction-modification system subunit M N-terminal domain-containing protein [Varibaculum cambriense]